LEAERKDGVTGQRPPKSKLLQVTDPWAVHFFDEAGKEIPYIGADEVS
jgi:hypothetical protein